MAVYNSAAEEIEAMLNGNHESEDSGSEEQFENEESFDNENDEAFDDENANQDGFGDNAEETDEFEEENENEDEGSETNDDDDDQNQETDTGDSDENENENDGNSQEEDNDESENNDDDTKDESGDSNQETSKFDPEEFEKLKSFYEKVTGEFKANGKTIKGFSDPDKIIQGLQKAIGFEEKNAVINKHRKFLTPLKEKGFLDNPEKFNLAMSIMDGDKEAIKEHLKSLDINPVLDLDLEEIKYQQKEHRASDGKVILDDVFETAEQYGIKDKLSDVLAKELDDGSFSDFIRFPKLREDLLTHIQDGTYDLVKERMDQLRLVDISGEYKSAKVVDQYRFALEQLSNEYAQNNMQKQNTATTKVEDDTKALIKNRADNIMSQAVVLDDATKNKILEEEKAKYAEEVRKKIQADEARKAAASVSKTKKTVTSTKKKEEFDPLALTGDEFKSYFETLMR